MSVRTIWKIPIAHGQSRVAVPPGSTLRSIAIARGEMCAWYEVDPAMPASEDHLLWVIATGDSVPPNGEYFTMLMDHLGYVWHAYACTDAAKARAQIR